MPDLHLSVCLSVSYIISEDTLSLHLHVKTRVLGSNCDLYSFKSSFHVMKIEITTD